MLILKFRRIKVSKCEFVATMRFTPDELLLFLDRRKFNRNQVGENDVFWEEVFEDGDEVSTCNSERIKLIIQLAIVSLLRVLLLSDFLEFAVELFQV
jgi:hypothetical protein